MVKSANHCSCAYSSIGIVDSQCFINFHSSVMWSCYNGSLDVLVELIGLNKGELMASLNLEVTLKGLSHCCYLSF